MTSSSPEEMIQALQKSGYRVIPPPPPIPAKLPDRQAYRVQVMPWPTYAAEFGIPEIGEVKQRLIGMQARSLVAPVKMAILVQLLASLRHLPGEAWEAGVYQGGTARLFSQILHVRFGERTPLRLFDTFAGMPKTRPDLDRHTQGNFADTTLEFARNIVGENPFVHFHPGLIPDTFAGLEDARIKFAHIDVDIHDAVRDTLSFVYPRMDRGVIVSDDYGFTSCPGARRAFDDFFADKPEAPVSLPTGQAIVWKLG